MRASVWLRCVSWVYFFLSQCCLVCHMLERGKDVFSQNDVLTISAALMTSFCAKRDMERTSQVLY